MQYYTITGYRVPWANTPTSRPVFTSTQKMKDFLDFCKVGYTKRTDVGTFFNERQETIVLNVEEPTARGINILRNINYLGIECEIKPTEEGTPATYETLYYFVDEMTVPPVYEGDPVTIIARIRPDAWITYGVPKNSLIMNNGAVIDQSTPLSTLVGGGHALDIDVQSATTPLYQNPPSPSSANDYIYAPAVRRGGRSGVGDFGAVEIVGGYPSGNKMFFVGLFTDADGHVYALGRPYSEMIGKNLNVLTTVTKIARAQLVNGGYTYDPEAVERDIQVDLYAAYIVPEIFATSQIPLPMGYAIKGASGLDENLHIAFKLLDIVGFGTSTSLYVPISLTWRDLYNNDYPGDPPRTVFLDIGTAYNRLQIPTENADSNIVGVRFTGTFSASGFSLVMEAGGQSIDIGGDFAVAVPDNTKAEFFARNKWSMALQGVASVGSVIASAATANPVAFVGATISAGQYAANVAQNANTPATVQGQGNGSAIYNMSVIPSSYGSVTRGAVYLRYYFGDEGLFRERVVRRYGYKWKNAIVYSAGGFSEELFGVGATNPPPARRFIKVVNPEVVVSKGWSFEAKEMAYTPAWARDEINEIFSKGVLLYYDPDPFKTADEEGGFGW